MDTRFEYSFTSKDETGLSVLRVEDTISGIVINTILPNDDVAVASVMSYVASRYSRSDKSVVELLKEIKAKGTDAVQAMSNIFRKYGHASVADMGNVFCYIENIPSLYATRFFMESSVGAGMERSTRYQDFGKGYQAVSLTSLGVDPDQEGYNEAEKQFIATQDYSLQLYKKWYDRLFEFYGTTFNFDLSDKSQIPTLKARTFDTARAFLPWGGYNKTSLGYVTSAREWSRLIGVFKGDSDELLVTVGEMLELLLAPNKELQSEFNVVSEVDELIRYTNAEETSTNNLTQLENWLVQQKFSDKTALKRMVNYLTTKHYTNLLNPEKTLINYISVLRPYTPLVLVIDFVNNLSDHQWHEVGYILLGNHNHHKQMPILARNGGDFVYLDGAYSEMRDMNRHRSLGRVTPLLLSSELINEGSKYQNFVLPEYIVSFREQLFEDFSKDIFSYQDQLKKFEDSFAVLQHASPYIPRQLWLFCVSTPQYLFGSLKEFHYLTNLRVRPGGHINYRILSQMIALRLVNSHPMYASLKDVALQDVDPLSESQFKDRS
jgi:thymidylate synthase ThyX